MACELQIKDKTAPHIIHLYYLQDEMLSDSLHFYDENLLLADHILYTGNFVAKYDLL